MADINVPTDAPILPYHISHQLTSVARHGNGRIKKKETEVPKKEGNGCAKEKRKQKEAIVSQTKGIRHGRAG